ncbi:MAG TPA: acyl-CoA dehydrogenase family protein [Thermodesulfobacteriota bacterium]|nr:acyl-CoA dehydrogenase family protein [Thermodesulfobacteriota bacterium]
MDFNLSDESKMLKSNAEKFMKEKSPSSFVKNILKEEKGFSEALWKEMAGLGWLGLIYAEPYGGSGGNFFDLFVLFEEMGKAVFPSPFFCSAVFAGLLINEAGNESVKKAYLPGIIEGKKILTVGLQNEQFFYDYQKPALEARGDGKDSFRIRGTRLLVPYAHVADETLVCAKVMKGPRSSGSTLFITKAKDAGIQLTPLNTITGEKSFAVTYADYPASSKDILGSLGKGAAYVEKVMPKLIALKCGEMVGGLSKVVDMTVDYVKQRVQFGKPLGVLQVVQHYCADMTTLLDTARMIAYQAASLISAGLPCAKEVAMAKAWCSDAYKRATQVAHQLHGGIGFTEEHDLHLYYKHAKALEMEFGDSWVHRQRVAEAMGL